MAQRTAFRIARLGLAALAFGVSSSRTAQAQSIRDEVEQHVDQGLAPKKTDQDEKTKTPTKRPEKKQSDSERQPGTKPPQTPAPSQAKAQSKAEATQPGTKPPAKAAQPDSAVEASTSTGAVKKPVADPLPRRVLGDSVQLDPKIGAGYRGWLAQDYPRVAVPHTGYFTWSLELRAKLFRYVNLRRGYYESNGLSAPRSHAAAVAVEAGTIAPKAAWLFGMIGIDVSPAWQPVVAYEARAFQSTAKPRAPVRIMPHDTPADTDVADIPETTQTLRVVSGFETLVLGVRYDPARSDSSLIGASNATVPAFYGGVGFTSYSKPYQVRVGDSVLNELLFDARFRGAGLALGLDTPERLERVSVDFAGQVGLGEVRLLDDLTLNQTLPADWLIGYLQGNLTVGYLYPLLRTKPTLLLSLAGSAGGMTFFFFKTKSSKDESVDTPPLNWDFLWSLRAALILPL